MQKHYDIGIILEDIHTESHQKSNIRKRKKKMEKAHQRIKMKKVKNPSKVIGMHESRQKVEFVIES